MSKKRKADEVSDTEEEVDDRSMKRKKLEIDEWDQNQNGEESVDTIAGGESLPPLLKMRFQLNECVPASAPIPVKASPVMSKYPSDSTGELYSSSDQTLHSF